MSIRKNGETAENLDYGNIFKHSLNALHRQSCIVTYCILQIIENILNIASTLRMSVVPISLVFISTLLLTHCSLFNKVPKPTKEGMFAIIENQLIELHPPRVVMKYVPNAGGGPTIGRDRITKACYIVGNNASVKADRIRLILYDPDHKLLGGHMPGDRCPIYVHRLQKDSKGYRFFLSGVGSDYYDKKPLKMLSESINDVTDLFEFPPKMSPGIYMIRVSNYGLRYILEVQSDGTGSIAGNLSYPSEYIPSLTIVAFEVQNGEPTGGYLSVETKGDAETYLIENLPAGHYWLVAYPRTELGRTNPNLCGGYTKAVPCGLKAGCDDHSMLEIEVKVGQTAKEIDPADWYAPDHTFPACPIKIDSRAGSVNPSPQSQSAPLPVTNGQSEPTTQRIENTTGLERPISRTQPSIPVQPVKGSYGMMFVLIPAGRFIMGFDDGTANEKPVHQVTISHAFQMQTTEVTQQQWQAVMGGNPSNFEGDDLPVEQVSWNDVQEFIRKLNALEPGKDYRLPTEAEWEYACRAGSTTKYYWGSEIDGAFCWNNGNSGGRTHPIGEKTPNPWGLYDMQGNVSEFCQDGARVYAASPVTDPKGPLKEEGVIPNNVFRGGGWTASDAFGRWGGREGCGPVFRKSDLGFRLVRAQNP